MGTLTGFIVGYALGTQQGPEGHARLRAALDTILEAPEVKQLLERVPGLIAMAKDGVSGPLGAIVGGNLGGTLGAVTSSEAWQSVSSSPQVASLLETGRSLVQGVLERGMEIMSGVRGDSRD